MAHETEKRDMLIAGGIVVAVLVLIWLALRNKQTPAEENTWTDPVANTSNPPSYNLPPSLQLPPFNVGNAPTSGGSGTGGSGSHCGCDSNVCGSGGGSDYLSRFLQTMSAGTGITTVDNGLTMGASSLSPISPITIPAANIVGPPASNTYSVWRAKEGLDPPGAGNNNTHQRDSIPPGLTAQQQFKLYTLLNGALFGNTSIDAQNKIMAQVYEMPTVGPMGTDSGGTGANVMNTHYGYTYGH